MDNNSKNMGDINVSISAGNNKIKYYECNDDNCIFEILDNNSNDYNENKGVRENNSILNETSLNSYDNIRENHDLLKNNKENLYNIEDIDKQNYGEIIVTSILDCGEQEQLEGVKINLYKINGLSPELVDSKITDEQGKVIFSNVEDGCYRIIELVDKRYFEKPKYLKWNEITIDSHNKKQSVLAINKIKRFSARNKCN